MDESSSMGQWLLFGVDKLQGTAYIKKKKQFGLLALLL